MDVGRSVSHPSNCQLKFIPLRGHTAFHPVTVREQVFVSANLPSLTTTFIARPIFPLANQPTQKDAHTQFPPGQIHYMSRAASPYAPSLDSASPPPHPEHPTQPNATQPYPTPIS
uniref:Uncharacterized protein n=1 Tax=Vitrella brassicaformis TaxID=1169539 RepID=A0A7S1PDB7_9ALVE